jgi:hypothetical protein
MTFLLMMLWPVWGSLSAYRESQNSRRPDAYLRDELTPSPQRPDIVKQDCQKLVDGSLLFEPYKIMRQGQPYFMFARLSKNPAVSLTEGLNGSDFVIVTERVSCKVSMELDSQEQNAFTIEKVPEGRKDDQLLEADRFAEWDWRVTPRKHGEFHLLLFVTPMLYVDGVGEGLTRNPQAPRVITVTPDYLYESTQYLKNNWTIIGGLLTAIFIPLFLWFRTGILEWINRRYGKK